MVNCSFCIHLHDFRWIGDHYQTKGESKACDSNQR
jgi:hypothetical protein